MTLLHPFVHSWRSLRRAPVFGATVVLTLTIGIGAATAIFAVVNAVLMRPLPYGHPERLVGAWHDLPGVSMTHAQQTSATYATYKRFAHTLQDIALYNEGSINVSDPDGVAEPQRMLAVWASANLFPLLEVPPLLGRGFNDAEDAPKIEAAVVVISEGLWRTRYGATPNVIGKKLLISGRQLEIIGVMPNRFQFPSAAIQLWMPTNRDPNDPYPGGFNHNAVARLKPGVTVETAERDLAAVLPRMLEISPNLAPGVPTKMLLDQAKPIPRLIPLRDDLVSDISRTLWIVAAAAVLVLLVTCANVANLLLVRADGRHRELSVRAALGAGRGQVLMHFFTESGLLAGISAILGLGAAAVGIRLLVTAGPAQIPRLAEIHLDWMTAAFTVVVAIFVALACGAIPAIRFMRADTLAGLRDGGRGGTVGRHRQRARGVLVAAQMAFALVVLAASGLLLRSFQRLHAVRPGYNADGVATLWVALPEVRYKTDTAAVQFFARLTERVAHVPGVRNVGITSRLPLQGTGMNLNPFYVEGDDGAKTKIPPLQIYTSVDSGYFGAMGIPLVAGRTFYAIDGRQRADEAIISQETARHFFHDSTGRAALGKRFQSLPNGPWYSIVGVVRSVRDTSLSSAPTPAVYFPETWGANDKDDAFSRTMAVVARTSGDVTAAARAMQRVVRDLDPTLPTFDVRSMRATMDASMARLAFTMIILGVAAGVTLVLGVIGLYGVIAYIVTLRTRELGVRIALGAQPRAVATMVTKQGLALSAAGIVVGLGLVLVVSRFLRSFLFEVAPTDPLTLGAATATLVTFALIASWIPARRASRVNPTEALRSD